MEFKVFEKGIAMLLAVFPHLKVEFKIYYEFLKDIPDESFTQTIHKIIKTVKELYPNTNIIALIRENAVAEGVPAVEAWGEVMKQIRSEGNSGHPVFSTPEIATVVKAIGWRNFCMSENIDRERKDFLSMYKELSHVEKIKLILGNSNLMIEHKI